MTYESRILNPDFGNEVWQSCHGFLIALDEVGHVGYYQYHE